MLKSHCSENGTIKFEHTFIPSESESLILNGENRRSLFPFFLELLKNSHTHGLSRWNTYCGARTKRLITTPEVNILDQNIALDLPLDERAGHGTFGCIGTYVIQMHKEQRNKHTFFFID
jgi:hypothetical protein